MNEVFITGENGRRGVDTLVIVPGQFFVKPETLSLEHVPYLLDQNGVERPKKGKTAILSDEAARENPRVMDYIRQGLGDRESRAIFLNPDFDSPQTVLHEHAAFSATFQDPVQTGGFASTTFTISKPNYAMDFVYLGHLGFFDPFGQPSRVSPIPVPAPSYSPINLLSSSERERVPQDIAQRLNRLYNLANHQEGKDRIALVREASRYFGIDERIGVSQILQESSFNPAAVGPMTKYGTAKGMGQFIDSTFQIYYHKVMKAHPELRLENNPFNPRTSAYLHAAYMRDNLERFRGNASLALAAYNWGEGNLSKSIQRHGTSENGNPTVLPNETRGYLRNILSIARELDLDRLKGAPAVSIPRPHVPSMNR